MSSRTWSNIDYLPLKILSSLSFDEVGTNALYPLANVFRFGDSEASHVAGMLHMWATTDLHRVIPNLVDFDQVTVALTEEGQRTQIERLLQWHYLHRSLKVALNLLVHDFLNAPDLFGRQLVGVREVKTQSFRCNVASHLVNMRPQHITQRLVEQVRCSMQLCSTFAMVGQSTGKPSLVGLTRALLVLLEKCVDAIQVGA